MDMFLTYGSYMANRGVCVCTYVCLHMYNVCQLAINYGWLTNDENTSDVVHKSYMFHKSFFEHGFLGEVGNRPWECGRPPL